MISINLVFVLTDAVESRSAKLDQAFGASLTIGSDQFCTNPELVIVRQRPRPTAFIAAVRGDFASENQTMLTAAIAEAYRQGVHAFSNRENMTEIA